MSGRDWSPVLLLARIPRNMRHMNSESSSMQIKKIIAALLLTAISSSCVIAQDAAAPKEDDFYPLTKFQIPKGIVLEAGAIEPLPTLPTSTASLRTAWMGWAGFGTVALSIALSLIPPAVESPLRFELKVVGGVAGFLIVGWWLGVRGVRQRTASGVGPS